MVQGFYEWNQAKILDPYFEDFYNILSDKKFYKAKGYWYLKDFTSRLLPRFKDVT